jgi:hypothetical protein
MLSGLLLEYTGALLILMTLVYTHANPILVGLAYMSALFLGDGKATGYFNPLAVIIQYCLGRMTYIDAIRTVGVHILAATSVVLFYTKTNLIYTS